MRPPRVSIVMAAYNAEDTIGRSIESILDQSYRHWELIVVDDASVDGTCQVVEPYVDGTKVRLVRNSQNIGGAASRAVGFRLAAGEYVAIQDADDISVPGRLDVQLGVFEEFPETDVVGGQMLDFGSWGGPQQSYVWATDSAVIKSRLLRGGSPIADPTAMIRRSAYKQAGGYDITLRRAYDLALYLKMKDRVFRSTDRVLVHYRTKRPLPIRYCLIEGRYRYLVLRRYLYGDYDASLPDGFVRFGMDIRSMVTWLRRAARETLS